MFIFHSKNNGDNNQARVTVVGTQVEDIFKLSVSKCSPLDQFSRKQGVAKAITRMEIYDNIYTSYKIPDCSCEIFVALAKGISEDVLSSDNRLSNEAEIEDSLQD